MNHVPEELLALRRVVSPAPADNETERQRLIAQINVAAALERRRVDSERRRRLWGGVGVAAATLLALGATLFPTGESGTVAQAPTGSAPSNHAVSSPALVEQGIRMGSGAQLTASPEASFRIEEGHQADEQDAMVFLSSGSVALEVPPLGERSLTVRTPHTDVVVHGTRFSVSVLDEPRPRTHVEVEEGVVSVTAQAGLVFLRAGESWSSERLAQRRGSELPEETLIEQATTVSPNAVKAPQAGTLAEENRLYRAAMQAKRSGQSRLAVRKLEELLGRFPKSPLSTAAQTERSRLLEELAQESSR